jgi:hypothetical protein
MDASPQNSPPLSIPAALLVFHIAFCLILAFGIWVLSKGYNPNHSIRTQRARNPAPFFVWFILIVFAPILPIIFSDAFASSWTPTYGAHIRAGLPIDGVKAWVFIVDILIVSVLIFRTGGWKASPFPSLNFSIPAIAILLGDSGSMVAAYTGLVAIIYGGSLGYARLRGRVFLSDRPEDDVALWILSIAALALTTTIGVLTRHAPQ